MRCSMEMMLFLGVFVPVALAGVELMSEETEEASLKPLVDDEDDGETVVQSIHKLSASQLASVHNSIDANGDGNVTMAEIQTYAHNMRRKTANKELSQVMDAHDTDKDGKLNLHEFIGELHKYGAGEPEEKEGYEDLKQEKIAAFKELDQNGDGHVDADELPLMFHHHTSHKVEEKLAAFSMKQKDVNGDGVLSKTEFWSHMTGTDSTGEISPQQETDFARLDVDGSGTLDLEEVKAYESGADHTNEAMKELFDVVDQDHDSLLTAYELLQAKERLAATDGAHMHIMNWHNTHKEL